MALSRVGLYSRSGLVSTLDVVSASVTRRLDEPGEFRLDLPVTTTLPSGPLSVDIYTVEGLIGGGRVLNVYRDSASVSISGKDHMFDLCHQTIGTGYQVGRLQDLLKNILPPRWTFDILNAPPNDSLLLSTRRSNILEILLNLIRFASTHIWLSAATPYHFLIDHKFESGTTHNPLSTVTSRTESSGVFNRVYAYGSGSGDTILNLSRATRSFVPKGYELQGTGLDTALANLDHLEKNGPMEVRADFSDVGPLSLSDGDVVAASNLLLMNAISFLHERSTPNEELSLDFSGPATVSPGDRVKLPGTPSTWVSECTLQSPPAIWSATLSPYKKKKSDPQSLLLNNVLQSRAQRVQTQLSGNRDTTSYQQILGYNERISIPVHVLEDTYEVNQILVRFYTLPDRSPSDTIVPVGAGSDTLSLPNHYHRFDYSHPDDYNTSRSSTVQYHGSSR